MTTFSDKTLSQKLERTEARKTVNVWSKKEAVNLSNAANV